ncbi:MAG: AAA family ATPase [Candidatus Parabeggiatoa sp.]|nr:AAA family ATPase [Candidatus Parabeggiatoa sp.]
MLHRHLRELGYQRIVFYNSGEQKIDTYDTQSSALVRPNAEPQSETPRRTTKICVGPLGQRRQFKARPKPQTTPQLTAVNNLEAVVSFNRWMNEAQPKTAIIFTNGIDFITHFETAAQRQMSVALENWGRLFEDNQNICLFLLSGISVQRLLELQELRRQWFFLFNQMFNADNTPTHRMIPIGAPRLDEVNNLLNYWRLKYDLPTDWRIFPTASAHMTRYLCSQGESLKFLTRRLRNCQALNKKTLSELAGQTEHGSALERLRQMKGLEVVADKIKRLSVRHQEESAVNSASSVNARHTSVHTTVTRLLPNSPSPAKGRDLHLALLGNPGTGKTTAARLIGEIYRDAGLLELGHVVKASREDLVAGYVGQTALQTAQKIADAMGGVLFVDEAYRLTQGGNNDFGKEAIETIMEAMETHKGEFAVIIAGYPQRIEEFLETNPGLPRRFSEKNRVTIPDYDPQTLQFIFEQYVTQQNRQLDKPLHDQLPDFFTNWYAERDEETFGNAGDVLSLYEEMDEQRAIRVQSQPDNSKRFTLTEADVPERLRPTLKPRQPDNLDDVLKSLDHLIGLQRVKDTVQRLVNTIKMEKLRGGDSQLAPGHYIFVGNPGTGKTTVARLMGNIFKALCILKKGELIEVGRSDLVAGYMGQSALKTRTVLERSMDNVLFIDEAYQLVTDERDSFGFEALETLVATMENQRHRLCIIAAGYPAPMQRFINSNPGLPSRFAGQIVFENYTATEMLSIFKSMAQERSLTLGESVENTLLTLFRRWEMAQSPTFGNGRSVRNLLEAACARQENRLVEQGITDKALLYRLEQVDIPI